MMFIGTTGFGKTYLAAHALDERQYVVVHDGKRTFREKEWVAGNEEWTIANTLKECVRARTDRICYSPTRFELRDEETQAQFFEWVLRRGHTTLLIDEMTLVTDGQSMPEPLQDLYATGREPGCEVWACTQQPVFVPNLAFTQSRCFYVFYCALGSHRTKIASFVPIDPDAIAQLQEHEYLVYMDTWRAPQGPCILVEGEKEEAPGAS